MSSRMPSFLHHPVNGVLLLDKPVGVTSNAALQRAKHLLGAAKAGHIGTLDPLASGLLPVCLGEATKFSSSAFFADKVYFAEIVLGMTTTTGDAEGDVVTRAPVRASLGEIGETLRRFVGTIAQTPPRYSAVKRNGKALYAYARAGETMVVAPRPVRIYELQLLDYNSERLRVRVHCGSGTYVRALAEDIGRELGCGAMLAALRRLRVGMFDISAAVDFDAIEATPDRQRANLLLPIEQLVSALPECVLNPAETRRVVTGRSGHIPAGQRGQVRLYDAEHRFLGIGEVLVEGTVTPRRLLATAIMRPAD